MEIRINVKFRRNSKERYWEVANTNIYSAFDILKDLVEKTQEDTIEVKITKIKAVKVNTLNQLKAN